MKTKILWSLLVGGTAVIGLIAAPQKHNITPQGSALMREKLALSQKILEGLALEKFDEIEKRAARLSAISRESDWRIFDNPEYDHYSSTFRLSAESIVKAAREKNLDAATFAYVRMTMSCVDCHKGVRGKAFAGMREPPVLQVASGKVAIGYEPAGERDAR